MPVVKGLIAVQSTTKCKESDFEYLETMAQSAGFEPATVRLEGGCSIQLSYDCVSDEQRIYSDMVELSTRFFNNYQEFALRTERISRYK